MPKVTGTRGGNFWLGRNVVGIAIALFNVFWQQSGQLFLAEAKPLEVCGQRIEFRKFLGQEVQIPAGQLSQLVISNAIGLGLLRGKIFGDKLMLIDKAGKQKAAPDGTYTIHDGTKITVAKGRIIEIPTIKSKLKESIFSIIEIDTIIEIPTGR